MRGSFVFWCSFHELTGDSDLTRTVVGRVKLATKLYGVNATIIIFMFVLYCIVLYSAIMLEEINN